MKTIRPLSSWEKFADLILTPLMYLLAGCFSERPQQTHFWNNQRLTPSDLDELNPCMMVTCKGNPSAIQRTIIGIPMLHIPILGGWKRYVVLEPTHLNDTWHVGWITKDARGISRIIISNKVRLLIGREEVKFFGVSAKGEQVAIYKSGEGSIGDGGPHRKVPLL